MGRGPALSDTELMKIRVMHGKDWSASKISRELGKPRSTVTRAAARMGMYFDHAQMAAATAAAATDMKARRARLAERALIEAEGCFDDLHRPYMDHAFSQAKDKEERYSQHAAMPTPIDKSQLMRAAATAMAEHRRLAEFDSEDGSAASRSMLGALAAGLAAAAGHLDDPGDDES